MSGDVQPRKRKDKKRKKDELGVEEPRGTAAALGEGDVFMHSQHDHGTGGHWCAKIIFFSLLAILVTLIGLIILENRGLSELEANSVESRYSGVLEGWLEDAPDDDHHDEHTLELNHHEDEEHEEEDEDDEEVEVEKLEKETPEDDLEPVSTELPALPEEEDDDDNEEAQSDEKEPEEEEEDDSGIEDEGDEFLEVDDSDEPPIEKITVPAGKPFAEVEEEVSSEQPPDTLEEEEEYEKQQEELRKEEAQASHMWLKLGVGAALLVATHAVVRRATHSRDTPEREEVPSREETPLVDRRLTLIPEETPVLARKVQEITRPVAEKQVLEKVAPVLKSIPVHKQESEAEEEEPHPSEDEEEEVVVTKPADDKELYSDEELEEEVEEDDEEEVVPVKKEIPKPAPVAIKKPEPEPEPEPEDDEDPEDVEIIGDEQLDEELEEEVDEEEISDVDDAELLSRLEAKYGKLPEPERPGPKQKDGGNSIEDGWPGEPSDAFWRQQLDSAERELRQDWLD